VIVCTSPRTTQLLHQLSDLKRLLDIGVISHQSARFRGQSTSASFALGGLGDGLAGGLGARDPSASGDFVERAQAVRSEAQ
jgi:hypothetical protein